MGDVKFLKLITSIEKTLISKAMKEKQLFFFFFFTILKLQASDPLLLFSLVDADNSQASFRRSPIFPHFPPLFKLCLWPGNSFSYPLSLSLRLCFSQILFILHDQWLLTYYKPFLSSSLKDPHGSDPATHGRVFCREYLCVFYLHQHIKQEVKDQLLLPLCASRLLTWCHQYHSHSVLIKMKEGGKENSTGNWDTRS